MRGDFSKGAFGVGLAVAALTVSACGGSSKAAVAAPTTAGAVTSATSSVPTTAAPTTPSPTATTPAAKVFTGAQLMAALPKLTAFEPGLQALPGFPKAEDTADGAVSDIASQSCNFGVIADNVGSTARGSETARSTGSPSDFVTLRAMQFAPGDAALMLSAMKTHTNTACATVVDAAADGNPADKVLERAVDGSGLGDQSLEIDQTTTTSGTGAGAPEYSRILDVRFGDVVVSVSFDSTDQARVQGFDLGSRAKLVAAGLGLG